MLLFCGLCFAEYVWFCSGYIIKTWLTQLSAFYITCRVFPFLLAPLSHRNFQIISKFNSTPGLSLYPMLYTFIGRLHNISLWGVYLNHIICNCIMSSLLARGHHINLSTFLIGKPHKVILTSSDWSDSLYFIFFLGGLIFVDLFSLFPSYVHLFVKSMGILKTDWLSL